MEVCLEHHEQVAQGVGSSRRIEEPRVVINELTSESLHNAVDLLGLPWKSELLQCLPECIVYG